MTRMTALIIQTDPQVYATALGPMPNGLYGVYIGTYDESPSGFPRPRVLLTSDGEFVTSDEAIAYGESLIRIVRLGDIADVVSDL